MQEIAVGRGPEWNCNMYSYVPPNVDVFHFLAYSSPKEVDDIEVFEGATDVVSEIDTINGIAARRSPVS